MHYQDDLRIIVAALPRAFKTEGGALSSLIEHHMEQRTEYWLAPVSMKDAAALFDMTYDAWRTRCSRHGHPPGWDETTRTYSSRLSLLIWYGQKMGWLEQGELEVAA